MDYFDKQQSTESPKIPAVSTAFADINARESDIREQFNAGKIPGAVFKSWLAEFAKERDAINRPRHQSRRESRALSFCRNISRLLRAN